MPTSSEGPARSPAPGNPQGALREATRAFLAATALASALFWTGRAVPLVGDNLHGLIAVVFLYMPWLAARLSGRPFDYREQGGLFLPRPRVFLAAFGLVAVATWPAFVGGFFGFYGTACRPEAPPVLQWWWQTFAPVCPRWQGAGAPLRLPPAFLSLIASQVLVVALPEELFFRGYLWARLEARWPLARRRLAGAPVGATLVASSAFFAVGHVLVDFNPQRLVVFFPGLVFGWLRARTGSIAPGVAYHAGCNLLSDVLYETYFGATP